VVFLLFFLFGGEREAKKGVDQVSGHVENRDNENAKVITFFRSEREMLSIKHQRFLSFSLPKRGTRKSVWFCTAGAHRFSGKSHQLAGRKSLGYGGKKTIRTENKKKLSAKGRKADSEENKKAWHHFAHLRRLPYLTIKKRPPNTPDKPLQKPKDSPSGPPREKRNRPCRRAPPRGKRQK